jgi:protein phosphatase
MALNIIVPRRSLLALCGPAACGKSTFAAPRFLPTEIVSSDTCRAMVCDDEMNQNFNREAFDLFHFIIYMRMRLGRFIVADSTALQPFARRRLLDQARRYGYPACLLIFNVALETCLARDQLRPRSVGEQVMQYHFGLLQQALVSAPQEGWDMLYVLDEETMDSAQIEIGDVNSHE